MVEFSPELRFIIGVSLGDGHLHQAPSSSSTTLVLSHRESQQQYADYKLQTLNKILGTSTQLKSYLDKGYRAVRFGVTSRHLLPEARRLLYPHGSKEFDFKVLQGPGLEELAIFYMDDGSLHVRRRQRPQSIKYERTVHLCGSVDEDQMRAIAELVFRCTGARGSIWRNPRHTELMGLRLNSAQARRFIDAVKPYVDPIPCMHYKVDLTRTCSVKEWLRNHPEVFSGEGLGLTPSEPRTGPASVYSLTLEGFKQIELDISREGGLERLATARGWSRPGLSRHRSLIIRRLCEDGILDSSCSYRSRTRTAMQTRYPCTIQGYERLQADILTYGSKAGLARHLGKSAQYIGQIEKQIVASLPSSYCSDARIGATASPERTVRLGEKYPKNLSGLNQLLSDIQRKGTQQALADEIGCSAQYIGQYLKRLREVAESA